MCEVLDIADFDVTAAFEGIVKHGIFDYYRRCHILALDDALVLDARSVHDEVVSMTADVFDHTAHLRGESSIFLERFHVSALFFCTLTKLTKSFPMAPPPHTHM